MSGTTGDTVATPNLDAYQRQGGGTTTTEAPEPTREAADDDFESDILDELEGTKSKLETTEKKLKNLEKSSSDYAKFQEGLKNLISPEDKTTKDPDQVEIAELEASLEELIEDFEEAKKRGQNMPITQKVARKALESAIRAKKSEMALKKKFLDVEGKVDRMNDADHKADQKTYDALNGFMVNAMDQLYGPGFETQAQKDSMSKGVSDQINTEIARLKAEDPQAWRRIRSSADLQQRMITYYVERNIPPKARQIIEERKLQETPFTEGQLIAALREAKAKIKDPKEREKMITKIRRDLLELKYAPKRGTLRSRG